MPLPLSVELARLLGLAAAAATGVVFFVAVVVDATTVAFFLVEVSFLLEDATVCFVFTA